MQVEALVDWCNEILGIPETPDFTGAHNGLQVAKRGEVRRVAAMVDAGLTPIREAIATGADFIVVHHGLFWSGVQPVTGPRYEVLRTLIEANAALYSAHLPLDGHPILGNNVALAEAVELEVVDGFATFEGFAAGRLCKNPHGRAGLETRLQNQFPTVTAMPFGSESAEQVAVLTGSGAGAFDQVVASGADTLVTGELRQHHFNQAQELGLNVYACGHYATEVFGVQRLAGAIEAEFGLPWSFVDTACPL